MSVALRVAASPGERHIALTAGEDTLLDYAIWRPGAPDGIGDWHCGRVIARVPAMAGLFVALCGGIEGFLPETEAARGVSAGTLIGVRITRAAQGGKGPRLARADLPEDHPKRIARLALGPSPLDELAARHREAPILADDPALIAELRATFGARVARVGAAFTPAIEDAVAALAMSEVVLAGGVRAHFQPTEALTAIDLDTGAATAARAEKGAAQRAQNIAHIAALARQIRLRNLSGAIFIDFAGMKSRHRAALGPALAAALAEDPLKPQLLGFTALGFAEITRPRRRPPLHELLRGPHASGLRALRATLAALQERPGPMPRLIAAPAVIAALSADPAARDDFARLSGQDWRLASDPTLSTEAWRISA